MNEDIPLHCFWGDTIRRVDDNIPQRYFSNLLDLLLTEQAIVCIFKPEPIGVPQTFKLLLDNLAEELAWSSTFGLQHAADEQVDIVQITFV